MATGGITAKVDLTDILSKIDKATKLQAFKNGLHEAALTVQRVLQIYPPVRRGKQPFKTDKQRKYFFYALKKGLIEVPYVRRLNINSQDMRAHWEIESQNNGLTQIIGNRVSYSKYTHGNTSQSRYHAKTKWKTVLQITSSTQSRIERIVLAAIAGDL